MPVDLLLDVFLELYNLCMNGRGPFHPNMPLEPFFLKAYRYGQEGYDFSYRLSELYEDETNFGFPCESTKQTEDEACFFVKTEVHYLLAWKRQSVFEPCNADGIVFDEITPKFCWTMRLLQNRLLYGLCSVWKSNYFGSLGVPDDIISRLFPALFDFARSIEANGRTRQILLSIYVCTVKHEEETLASASARSIGYNTFLGVVNDRNTKQMFDLAAESLIADQWLYRDTLDVEICSICQEENIHGMGTRLACSHLQHIPCILGWIMKNPKNKQTCPECRAPVFSQ